MPPDVDPPTNFASLVARLARELARPDFPTGDHAQLRRMDPQEPRGATLALHRLLARTGVRDVAGEPARRWALIVHCLALVRGRHDRDALTGRGLHEAGVSEARLNQLLAADGEVLFDLLPRLARRLAAHGRGIDWLPLARIVRSPDEADAARIEIARSYARAQAA